MRNERWRKTVSSEAGIWQSFVYDKWAHLFSLVLSKLQTMDDLLVDEVCADLVLFAVMPRGEHLLAKEETPWSVLLLAALPFHFLLTLGDGVHDVLLPIAESPHLQDK